MWRIQKILSSENTKGMFVSYFWKLLLGTIFENTNNIILVLFENCFYYMSLVFSLFFILFKKKKKDESDIFSVFFFVLLVFQNKKQCSKTINNHAQNIVFSKTVHKNSFLKKRTKHALDFLVK